MAFFWVATHRPEAFMSVDASEPVPSGQDLHAGWWSTKVSHACRSGFARFVVAAVGALLGSVIGVAGSGTAKGAPSPAAQIHQTRPTDATRGSQNWFTEGRDQEGTYFSPLNQ